MLILHAYMLVRDLRITLCQRWIQSHVLSEYLDAIMTLELPTGTQVEAVFCQSICACVLQLPLLLASAGDDDSFE